MKGKLTKGLALLLSALLMLSLLPVGLVSIADTFDNVTTEAGLLEALQCTTASTISLGSDITIDTPIVTDGTVGAHTIMLNGYKLIKGESIAEDDPMITVTANALIINNVDNTTGGIVGNGVQLYITVGYKYINLYGNFYHDMNLKTAGNGCVGFNGTVVLNGNLTTNNSVIGNANCSVTVNGNVTSTAAGLSLNGGTSATINGNFKCVTDMKINNKSTLKVVGNVDCDTIISVGSGPGSSAAFDVTGTVRAGTYVRIYNGNNPRVNIGGLLTTTLFMADFVGDYNAESFVNLSAMDVDYFDIFNTGVPLTVTGQLDVSTTFYAESGVYNNILKRDDCWMVANGGSYKQDITDENGELGFVYLMEGSCAYDETSQLYVVTPDTSPVCKIGDTTYDSLRAAHTAAVEGDTIVLLRNYADIPVSVNGTPAAFMTITKNNLTVDLAGHNITDLGDAMGLDFGRPTEMTRHNGFEIAAPDITFTLTNSDTSYDVASVSCYVSGGASAVVGQTSKGTDANITIDKVELTALGALATAESGAGAIHLNAATNGNKLTMKNASTSYDIDNNYTVPTKDSPSSPHGITIASKTDVVLENCRIDAWGRALYMRNDGGTVTADETSFMTLSGAAAIYTKKACTINLNRCKASSSLLNSSGQTYGSAVYIENDDAYVTIDSNNSDGNYGYSEIDGISIKKGTLTINGDVTKITSRKPDQGALNINTGDASHMPKVIVNDGDFKNYEPFGSSASIIDMRYPISISGSGTPSVTLNGGHFSGSLRFANNASAMNYITLGEYCTAYAADNSVLDTNTKIFNSTEVYIINSAPEPADGSLSIDPNNSAVGVTIDGTPLSGTVAEKQSLDVADGTTVALHALTADNEFLFWVEDGKVRSENTMYQFPMYGARNVDAVFAPAQDSGTIVIYRNDTETTKQVVAYQTYVSGSDFTAHLAESATLFGKTFTGWDKDVSQIAAEIDAGTNVVYVNAVYSSVAEYSVLVNLGRIVEGEKESYLPGDKITITTDDPSFRYWDSDICGILSTDRTFVFTVPAANVYIAPQFMSLPDTESELFVMSSANGRLAIYHSFYLQDNYTLVDAGLIYSNTAGALDNISGFPLITDVNGTTIKATHLGGNGGNSQSVLNTIASSEYVSLCGYVIYMDQAGEQHVIYSSNYYRYGSYVRE